MNAEERAAALLQLIQEARNARQQALLDAAASQASELLRTAHAQARQHVREALTAARARLHARVALARAQQQTRQRLTQQAQRLRVLEAATAQLPAALMERWAEPTARAAWVNHAFDAAGRLLGAGPWQIRCAPGIDRWPDGHPAELRVQVDPSLTAGLRISAGGNCVDASMAGLLGDTDAVASLLLRALGGQE